MIFFGAPGGSNDQRRAGMGPDAHDGPAARCLLAPPCLAAGLTFDPSCRVGRPAYVLCQQAHAWNIPVMVGRATRPVPGRGSGGPGEDPVAPPASDVHLMSPTRPTCCDWTTVINTVLTYSHHVRGSLGSDVIIITS